MKALLQRPGLLLLGMAVLSIAAVGAALVSQHVYGMEPCPWCILQRVIFLAVALVCGVGFVSTRIAGVLALVFLLCGIAAALWQHFQAAASSSCALTVADRIVIAMKLDSLWPDVFLARASCADAAVSLMGIPYDFWSLAVFVVLAVVSVAVIRKR
ncbi:disulfide bond formation protein B [Piscinibacter gummiphilus]|uniref:Disulfide bond formation protein B n=1 Tax=Piscinibacter gummiphilus TaxID=946333 RepID=A0ABZ0CZB9_9BURK|nr:disulfide bond formation protein B [Piscinibacter gummiphilus]WOB10292.1 disulfide bond formation protein B [Piscinibacter gummiphilus]